MDVPIFGPIGCDRLDHARILRLGLGYHLVEVDERQLELLHRRSAKAFLFCLCASVVLG